MNRRDDEIRSQLAAEYVLGSMTARVRRRFEAMLKDDPHLQSLVAAWSNRLDQLGGRLPPVQPPKRVWKAISRRIAADDKVRLRRERSLWRGLAILSSMTAVILLAVLLVSPPREVPPTYLAVVQNAQVQSAWLVSLDSRAARIRVKNLVPQSLDEGKDFELWLLPAHGQAPVSLGVIPATSDTELPLTPTARAELAQAAGVAVSLEPAGGSPTGQPTGPVLYQGKLTPL